MTPAVPFRMIPRKKKNGPSHTPQRHMEIPMMNSTLLVRQAPLALLNTAVCCSRAEASGATMPSDEPSDCPVLD